MITNKILITGASGFVGRALLDRLSALVGLEVIASFRNLVNDLPGSVTCIGSIDINGETDWTHALVETGIVIHCAARVHVMDDLVADPIDEFRKVNVEGTLNLARQSVAAGVKRFIFVSSIKVNGESTAPGHPFKADDEPVPVDPYGVSKLEAEQGLRALSKETGLEVVIIRPVLVYGPGVKANFLSMMRWLNMNAPLPFGAVNNMRSLVAIDNLVDLIVTCIDHPKAANEVFLVSDGEDLSTPQLLRRMGMALGKSTLLIPVPSQLLMVGAIILGKRALGQRLCGSLQVDISKTRDLLGWSPLVSTDQGLRSTARYFLVHKQDLHVG